MIRTMMLIPLLAALLACGLFTRAEDPAAQVVESFETHTAPAEEPAASIDGPIQEAPKAPEQRLPALSETPVVSEIPAVNVVEPSDANDKGRATRIDDPLSTTEESSERDIIVLGDILVQVAEPTAVTVEALEDRIDDPLSTTEEESERTVVVSGDILAGNYGNTLIEEKILRNDPIVKATLTSLSSEVSVDVDGKYRAVLKFSLDVNEYLKGTGPSSIVAVWVDGWPYDTREDANAAKANIIANRDDRWDEREAIIFLYAGANGFGASIDGQLRLADHFLLALGHRYFDDDRYSLHSETNKDWLPAATNTGSTDDALEFLLDVPPATGTAPTITFGDLKTKITAVATEFDSGDGSEAYETCIKEKYEFERIIRYFREEKGRDGYDKSPEESSLASGQPANTELHQRQNGGAYPDTKAKTWFEGKDADLFTVTQGEPTDVDGDGDGTFTAGSDGIEFTETFATARPLPAGEYEINRREVWPRYLACNYVLDNEWTITVAAPEGTLHEAFFDPVIDGTAVAADDTNGVLKPTSFTVADGAAANVERIEWESGTVKLELSSDDALAGHVVDFIELDGTVSLSLHADDATVDAANDTLSWSVASQPWHDGDELMLRVRRGPCWNDTAVPNPANNPGLMRDCVNLLAAKDTLRGAATLNWGVDTAISDWDGVTVAGTPGRVTSLVLVEKSLTGQIPATLGNLTYLENLLLANNQMIGCIPPALKNIDENDLADLDLADCAAP